MIKTARVFAGVLACGLVWGSAAVASAQTSAPAPMTTGAKHGTPHRTFSSPPIKINGCNPKQNNYVASGFTPAYYGGVGPYWGWPSVYGPAYTYYSYPVQGNPTLNIDYVNATDIVAKNIEFGLVVRGELLAEVRDVGTFSPGAEIKHEFGISSNVFPIRTGLPQCVPLKIDFVDGTKWVNPHLPALRATLYHHP